MIKLIDLIKEQETLSNKYKFRFKGKSLHMVISPNLYDDNNFMNIIKGGIKQIEKSKIWNEDEIKQIKSIPLYTLYKMFINIR